LIKMLGIVQADTPRDKFARGAREFKFPKWAKVLDIAFAGGVYLTVILGALFALGIIAQCLYFIYTAING
jgi:hypothetical protein